MPLPLAPERWAMVPAPGQAPLLEQLATLRLENAALRARNGSLWPRMRCAPGNRGAIAAPRTAGKLIAYEAVMVNFSNHRRA